FRRVFVIPPDDVDYLSRVFDAAKNDLAAYDFYARQLARLFKDRPEMLEAILDGLFYIAKIDNALHEHELLYLESVARIFGFDAQACMRIKARHVDGVPAGPWLVLGLDPSTDDATLRRHYDKLVQEYHPDRQIAAGIPEEMVAIA